MRIPLMLFSLEKCEAISHRFRAIGKRLSFLYPGLNYDLRALGSEVEAGDYAFASLLSAIVYGLVFAGIAVIILNARGFSEDALYSYSSALGIVFFALFFLLHLVYPGIVARKIADRTDKELVFALRDLMMEVESGISLYDAMVNVSQSDYGFVSKEFSKVVNRISSGVSERQALEDLALRTESEYLRKSIWQLITALESGASLSFALKSVIETLTNYQFREIKAYAASLNFLVLIYMLVAAAIPSLGLTFLVLLSAFSGIGVTSTLLAAVVGISFFAQIALIGFMKSSRPTVYE